MMPSRMVVELLAFTQSGMASGGKRHAEPAD